jgi:uncharacterized protein YkwD
MSRTDWRSTARPRRRLRLIAGLTAVAVIAAAASPHEGSAAAYAGQNAEHARPSGQHVARATLCLINAERRSRGLRRLRASARLSKAARRHSRTGYLRGAKDWLVGENLAWGTRARGTAREILRVWMTSPSHRRVLLTRSFRDVGVGVAWGVPDRHLAGGATCTVDFGVRY